MDTLLGQSESVRTPASMTARVLADAKRTYDGVVDDAVLERFAREAVDELCGDSIKVTTFVPVLAMRRVRDLLDAGQSTAIETAATV
jgi:hypothetical protein